MSVRPVDLGTKLLLVDMVKLILTSVQKVDGTGAIIDRYEAWLEAQRQARANYGKLGRPKFVITPEKQAVIDGWARTNPRPALGELAKALGCSIGKAHALAKALPVVAPAATVPPMPEAPDPNKIIGLVVNDCQECGCAGQLGAWDDPENRDAPSEYDVQCRVCPNRTRKHDTEMEAITAWNTANPVKI